MNVETRDIEPDIGVIHISGDMDLYSSNEVKDAATRLWEAGTRHLVIDLSELEYLDSSGVGVLLYIFSSSQKRGTSVYYAGAHGAVWKVIELTKLNGFLPIRSSVDAALISIRDVGEEAEESEPAVRQLRVDPDSPLFDTTGMYHKAFKLDLSQVRRLANLIAQKAPTHLRDINILEQQISELIKNAVRHGNQNDPSKEVKIWFHFADDSARLIVEDEGPGFQKLEEWNEFYRQKVEAYQKQDFERLMDYLAFRTEDSTEHDGGNAMMAAVEYWNRGVVFNERRNCVAVMRSFQDTDH